jgi:hypothetical protein
LKLAKCRTFFFRATKIRVLALHGSIALPISFQRLSKALTAQVDWGTADVSLTEGDILYFNGERSY